MNVKHFPSILITSFGVQLRRSKFRSGSSTHILTSLRVGPERVSQSQEKEVNPFNEPQSE